MNPAELEQDDEVYINEAPLQDIPLRVVGVNAQNSGIAIAYGAVLYNDEDDTEWILTGIDASDESTLSRPEEVDADFEETVPDDDISVA